jgi:membrane-bound lytic murein transglycosylase D
METGPGVRKKKKESRGSQYDTLWDRLFALYALPPIDHPDIDRELAWFANHPAYLERAQNRAEPFLYSIVKLVEKKNIPGELALLPIVESAFQPNVVSTARAAGIWQFIPSTGTNYGLKRSHSYDGRRDVYASTKAAIKYLKKLHGDFGDWLLAIAAYNCGEGAVTRAIRRNEFAGLPTDFWSLNLPQETRAYVPKLLAVARLFADAEKYGISLKDLPNVAKYKPVKVSNQLDLALAADAAGISLDKLYELNPGFRGQYADIDGSYHLYIPADKKAAEFRQEVERLSMQRRVYPPPRESYREAIPVEPSVFETFRREFEKRPPVRDDQSAVDPNLSASMAMASESEPHQESYPVPRVQRETRSHSSVSPARMRKVSTESESYSRERLPAKSEPSNSKPIVPASISEVPAKKAVYSVQKGETLYSVARRHSVNVAQLAKWNNIPMTTEVQAGQRLVVAEIPSGKKHSGPAASMAATARSGNKATSKAVVSSKEVSQKLVNNPNKVTNGGGKRGKSIGADFAEVRKVAVKSYR